MLIKVSRGGLELGENSATVGRGLAHSGKIEEGSSVPSTFEGGNVFLMREGAWILL